MEMVCNVFGFNRINYFVHYAFPQKKLDQKIEKTLRYYQKIAVILRIYIMPKKNKNIEIIFVYDIPSPHPFKIRTE